MAGGRSKKSRTRSAATEWRRWEYDEGRRCYVTSRINRHGVEEFQYSGECDPPAASAESPEEGPEEGLEEGLGEGVNGISLSPDEPGPEGDDDVIQGGRTLLPSSGNETTSFELSTSPYATSPGMISNSQRQDGGYTSPPTATGRGAQFYASNSSGYAQSNYTTSYGLAQSTGYGRGQPGSAMPYNSVDTSQSNGPRRPSVSWNPVPQYPAGFNGTLPVTNPANSNYRGQTPTGPANNSQYQQGDYNNEPKAAMSTVHVKDTKTDSLPQKPLWKEFKLCPSKDFREGYVFKVVWTEPDGNGRSRTKHSNLSYVTDAKHGELAYTTIRRFVIYKSHQGHSLCLPILTYMQQGTMKFGVKSWHHAIIYMTIAAEGATPPPDGLEGEDDLPNLPIRVEARSPRHELHVASRLNYAKTYTVEHNIKVSFIGRIHRDSIHEFREAYARVNTTSYDGLHPDNAGFGY